MGKRKQTYTHPGGVLAVPRQVIRSPAYRDMTLPARCLMLELQDVWKPSEPVIHYSSRRAAKTLGRAAGTGALALKDLAEHGFIEIVDDASWFNGKARTYRLTWLANNGREPTNEWMKWEVKNKSPSDQSDGQGRKRPISKTVDPKRTNSPTKNQQLKDDLATPTVLSVVHH